MNISQDPSSFEPVNPQQKAVLVVDPDVTQTSPLVERLLAEGFDVCLADGLNAAALHLRERTISYAMTEIRLNDGNGFAVIDAVKGAYPFCRTVVHSSFCTLAAAVQATKAGASDVLPKPLNVDFLVTAFLDRSFKATEFGEFLCDPEHLRTKYIVDTYRSSGASVARTARKLSMRRRTLQRFIRRVEYV